MRIVAFRVDGFGILTNMAAEDLSPGLNIIHGDNGAGKTTLLEFFRAILFGFRDRRGSLPRYEPVRGGSHGGQIDVVMADGRRFRIIRSQDTKVAGKETVLALDDNVVPPMLQELLGQASRDVYENVFAFSLAELQAVETLDKGEVPARLYAAGAGTGATSVPEIRRQLAEEIKRVYAPRAKCELISLLEEATKLLAEHKRLSGMAEEFARLQEERKRLEEALEAIEREEHARSEEYRFAQTLVDCWPDWKALRETKATLEAIGVVQPLPERAEERLEAMLQSIRERESALAAAETRAQRAAGEVEQAVAALGPAWTETRVVTFDTGDTTLGTIAEYERELDAARHEVNNTEVRVREAERALQKASEAREALEAEERNRWPEPPRALSSIDEDLEVVRAARQVAIVIAEERGKRAELEGQRHVAATEVRGLRQAKVPFAPVALIPLAIALIAMAAAAFTFPYNPTLAGVFAFVFLIATIVAIRSQWQRNAALKAEQARQIHEAEARLQEVENRIADVERSISERQEALKAQVAPFGLVKVDSVADLEHVEARLGRERDNAHEYAAFTQRLHEARRAEAEAADNLDAVRTEYDARQLDLQAIETRWAQWLEQVGLDASLTPQSAQQFVAKLRNIQEMRERRDQLAQEVREATLRLEEARQQAQALYSEAGDTDEGAFRRHIALWKEREALMARVRELEGHLQARAGSAESWPLVQQALVQGDEATLRERLASAQAALQEVRHRRDDMRSQLGQLDAELRRMESSTELEWVNMRLEEVKTRVNEALQRWAVRKMTLALLEEAQRRFERERQPAIIQKAGELLQVVTNGRYVRIFRPMSGDGEGPGELLAETMEGATKGRLQWNRGLLEQIYLCLRLAFIEDYCGSAEPLPIIMDDVLANFDPHHAQRTAKALAAFADKHQMFYLTCHPEIVDHLRNACPNAMLYRLADYQLHPMP